MSAAILRKMLREKSLLAGFIVDSAGTEALIECPPDEKTVSVCKDHEIDISPHRGQQVTHSMIRDATVVLTMAESHRRIIRGIFPQWESKILLLKEFGQVDLPEDLSVEDPTGRARRKYEKTFKELEGEIARIFPILEDMSCHESGAGDGLLPKPRTP